MNRILAAFALACCTASGAETNAVTFTKHIAPVLYEYCAPCHHQGGSAPFALLTYGDAKKHAQQIAEVTRSRFMPPWLPTPGYGQFQGERRLSDRQIELIRRWSEQGAAEGDPATLPPQPRFAEGWQLGKPDLIVQLPRPYTLRAGGEDVYRNFIFPITVDRIRYVKAIEIRPGNNRIVHHANVLIDRDRSSRHLDQQDGDLGFPGMELHIESQEFEPDGHFLFWKPGSVPFVEPAGMAWRVNPGTDLVLNMHLQPSGKPEPVQPSIGLYFTDTAPTLHPMLIQLENDRALDIPAGAKDFPISEDYTLPVDVDVLAVYPHAHYLGKQLEGYATLPDGTKKWLVRIDHWDLNWQAVFRYRKPVRLPKGTRVSMRYRYDNSEENPANPNRPPKRVQAGNRASDEMSHLWLQVLPVAQGEQANAMRVALQESLMRHKLDKEPLDFSANYNLGAVLAIQRKPEEASVLLRKAVDLEPDNATARNSLGATLEEMGKLDEAIGEFRHALRIQPDYSPARYNLANCLLVQGKFSDAAQELREVLRASPNDEFARNHLFEALTELGKQQGSEHQLTEAVANLRQAVELKPTSADAHTNLGTALAMDGKLPEAKQHFEQALRIDPDHQVARSNLAILERRLAGPK
jgi:Flp pilus assembly protein TadD/mono/diheme cytochrome c family protein